MAIRVRFKKSETKADAEHWITLHPNGKEAKGTPALINGAGQIIGGAGGKLTGKVVQPKSKSASRPGTEEQHAPAIWLGPAKPEQPKTEEPGEAPPASPVEKPDPELRKKEAKLAEAKEILEKTGKMPDFMRKSMEEDIARREKEIADYKREKGLGEAKAPEQTPEAPEAPEAPKPPEIAPEPQPEPTPEPPKEPEAPPQPEPTPTPEVKGYDAEAEEADRMIEGAKNFDQAKAAYDKYMNAEKLAREEGNIDRASEIYAKRREAFRTMSDVTLEQSKNAKTLQEHEAALTANRYMYDRADNSIMRAVHARMHNDHLKAIKKMKAGEARKAKAAAKKEEKRTGVKSKETEREERYAKATVEEISNKLQTKYGMGFVSKPDTTPLDNERAAIQREMYSPEVTPERKQELLKRNFELQQQVVQMERYARVKHFNAVDINAKTQSAKNARKLIAHVEDTFDELTASGYDIKGMMALSEVTFATGTTGTYGGLAWGSASGVGRRHFCVDANKAVNEERKGQIASAEEARQKEGMTRWNADGSTRGTIIHELAHAAGMNSSRGSPRRLQGILDKLIPNTRDQWKWVKENISEYGSKNILETDAELASLVLSSGYKRGTLPKELEDHVDWLFMKKGG